MIRKKFVSHDCCNNYYGLGDLKQEKCILFGTTKSILHASECLISQPIPTDLISYYYFPQPHPRVSYFPTGSRFLLLEDGI